MSDEQKLEKLTDKLIAVTSKLNKLEKTLNLLQGEAESLLRDILLKREHGKSNS